MWHRIVRGEGSELSRATPSAGPTPRSRRDYYRVSAWVALRLRPISAAAVDAAIYDLMFPDRSLAVPVAPEDEQSPLMARLRRIEEKLDRLLGGIDADTTRPLSGSDRRLVVFSGAGLALDVDFEFRRGDAFGVEMLLPLPGPRVVRAVAEAVQDSPGAAVDPAMRRLALGFRHIETGDRDALVAYSYEIQRLLLRSKVEGASVRA